MLTYAKINISDEIPSFTIKMDWSMYKQYNRLVHEINPLHFNEEYAKKLGFRTIVVAGVFTYGFYLRPVVNWIQKSAKINSVNIRFHMPVYLEDTVTQGATVTKKYMKENVKYVECEIWAKNQQDEQLISGHIRLIMHE